MDSISTPVRRNSSKRYICITGIAMSVHECLDFSEKYRETIAIYKDNIYYLVNNRGRRQGFMCE